MCDREITMLSIPIVLLYDNKAYGDILEVEDIVELAQVMREAQERE